jgi:hypothetical protein
MSTLLALLLAQAAPAGEDVYKDLVVGDRVQIAFRTGGTIIGLLIEPPAAGEAKAAGSGAPSLLFFTSKT